MPHGAHSTLSIVVPVLNEERNIFPLYEAVIAVWQELPEYAREIIFVDDGSTDGTWNGISSLKRKDASVKGIRFARNFGKESAIEAGLRAASGDAVITIDGDLQHPPELIPKMVHAWKAGNDIVRGHHTTIARHGLGKRATSFLFYRLFNLISDTPIVRGSSDFCLFSRRVVDAFDALPEKQKFHRLLSEWVGFPSASISYEARERGSGRSAYTLTKLFPLARRAIVSSATKPMSAILIIGCILSVLGVVLTFGLLYYKYFVDYEYIGGAVVLAAFVVFNNGLLFIAFGVMSLYQIAIYREVQNRPSYIVRETV